MSEISPDIKDLYSLFENLDGLPFHSYRKLCTKQYRHALYALRFLHIQGSTGAYPASVCEVSFNTEALGLADWCLATEPRRIATADYLLRAWCRGVISHARQNRGVQGSGSFQLLHLPPQVLKRNVVRFLSKEVSLKTHISLPGTYDNRVLGRQATVMFSKELLDIVNDVLSSVADVKKLKKHCDVIEDMLVLQKELHRYNLVAFIGNGAILPRSSGVSESPLQEGAVPFTAPKAMEVEVEFVNGGRQRGMGIRPGVNVLIGAGYHGKSTLLDALVKGVYPHIPGDGREQVVTHPEAAFVCAENGRAVNDLDISGFINNLPGQIDSKNFRTKNASGSTSQAAGVIESILAGAKLLLLDEDSSATNFLIKDRNMQQLIPKDTITPFFDRVRELYQHFDVSTMIVVGGSSEYLGVADQVIAMQNYQPACLNEKLDLLKLPEPNRPETPLVFADKRILRDDNFDPSFRVERLGKTIKVRIKPLRHQEKILEYGNEQLNMTKLPGLVDPYQVLAIGYGLLLARRKFEKGGLSPSELADSVYRLIEEEELDILFRTTQEFIFFARPRRLEFAGAINRLRNLRVEVSED